MTGCYSFDRTLPEVVAVSVEKTHSARTSKIYGNPKRMFWMIKVVSLAIVLAIAVGLGLGLDHFLEGLQVSLRRLCQA